MPKHTVAALTFVNAVATLKRDGLSAKIRCGQLNYNLGYKTKCFYLYDEVKNWSFCKYPTFPIKQTIMDYTQITIEASKLLIGAVIGTIFTMWYKDIKDKKLDKRKLFLRMIEAKGYLTIPQTLINDLNTIPILFRKNKKVLKKYRLYYESLSLKIEELDHVKQKGLYWDLLRAIGAKAGYGGLDNHVLSSEYIPNQSLDAHLSEKEFRHELLNYLKSGNILYQTLAENAKKS